MKTVNITEATESLAEYARQAAQEPIVVLKDGQPVAALVPIEDADLETLSLSTNPEFLALIERSRARRQAEGGTSAKEMRRRFL